MLKIEIRFAKKSPVVSETVSYSTILTEFTWYVCNSITVGYSLITLNIVKKIKYVLHEFIVTTVFRLLWTINGYGITIQSTAFIVLSWIVAGFKQMPSQIWWTVGKCYFNILSSMDQVIDLSESSMKIMVYFSWQYGMHLPFRVEMLDTAIPSLLVATQ